MENNYVIFKYPIQSEKQSHDIPADAVILNVQTQNDVPHIWVMLNTKAEKVKRRFTLIPTGVGFNPAGRKYMGTFHNVEGPYVFHLFETI